MPSELSNPLLQQTAVESVPMPTRKPSAAAPSPAKRPAHRPPHQPSKVDRATVSVMAAGAIAQVDIARARGISTVTLRKHYRVELSAGATALNTTVILAHIERIKAGDFQAIKWWEQARMGWRGDGLDEDGRAPADRSMRVTIELVGEPAPPTIDHAPLREDARKPAAGAFRRNVQLVG